MENKHSRHFLSLLERYLDRDLIVAFSGGVDSTLVLKAAAEICRKKGHLVYAVTFMTTLHPRSDGEITRNLAREIGVPLDIVEIDELRHAGIQDNPIDRCYLCKRYLFHRLREIADGMGVSMIMDGTNADDLHLHRPGLRALRELEIVSPLAEAKMSKADVRSMAHEYGLSVAGRPSTPCLATRFPYGTSLTREMLQQVEKGEDFLQSLGFYNVRLRVHETMARVEVDLEDIRAVIEQRERIVTCLRELGYAYVTLDLDGFRSGSMDRKK